MDRLRSALRSVGLSALLGVTTPASGRLPEPDIPSNQIPTKKGQDVIGLDKDAVQPPIFKEIRGLLMFVNSVDQLSNQYKFIKSLRVPGPGRSIAEIALDSTTLPKENQIIRIEEARKRLDDLDELSNEFFKNVLNFKEYISYLNDQKNRSLDNYRQKGVFLNISSVDRARVSAFENNVQKYEQSLREVQQYGTYILFWAQKRK